MSQKYPKLGSEYEDSYWRKLADRQAFNRKAIVFGIIAVITIGLLLYKYPKQIAKLEIKKVFMVASVIQFSISGTTSLYLQNSDPEAKFDVISEQGKSDNCLVKLEDWNSGIPIIEIYVRANEQAESKVPLGEFRVSIACGENWYGRNDMFGKTTRITVGLKSLKFWQAENKINGNILTLNKTLAGNFRTSETYSGKF
jgi:hypothetical protein